RSHSATEVVAETLARAADAGREQLGEEGAHPAEDPTGEESERKAEHQHCAIADRRQRVGEHRSHRAEREQIEVALAAELVREPGGNEISAERACDDDAQVSTGIEHGEAA